MNGDFAARAARDVDRVLRIRRARAEVFGAGLFSDPAWDILLQLFSATLRGSRLCLREVESDVPESTLARWAAVLEDKGLIHCEADPALSSTLWLSLSSQGELRMSGLLARFHELHPVG